MALFRSLDGNLYEIPDDQLAAFQIHTLLPQHAHLAGEEIAPEPTDTGTLSGTSNYIWNAPASSEYIWNTPTHSAPPGSEYIWNTPANSEYIWDAPTPASSEYIW